VWATRSRRLRYRCSREKLGNMAVSTHSRGMYACCLHTSARHARIAEFPDHSELQTEEGLPCCSVISGLHVEMSPYLLAATRAMKFVIIKGFSREMRQHNDAKLLQHISWGLPCTQRADVSQKTRSENLRAVIV
jgi:hypothetical protein